MSEYHIFKIVLEDLNSKNKEDPIFIIAKNRYDAVISLNPYINEKNDFTKIVSSCDNIGKVSYIVDSDFKNNWKKQKLKEEINANQSKFDWHSQNDDGN